MWEITQDGTDRSVNWVDYEPNPRFAIYDAWGDNYSNDDPYRYDDDAVLDKETGLVWQRMRVNEISSWPEACEWCMGRETGRRKGWRLPAVEELQTLVDTDVAGHDFDPPIPVLPPGHPFLGEAFEEIPAVWTTSSDPYHHGRMLYFDIDSGCVGGGIDVNNSDFIGFWCVRGGLGHDTPSPTEPPLGN